jgi:hypothetical protein
MTPPFAVIDVVQVLGFGLDTDPDVVGRNRRRGARWQHRAVGSCVGRLLRDMIVLHVSSSASTEMTLTSVRGERGDLEPNLTWGDGRPWTDDAIAPSDGYGEAHG